MKPVRHQCKLSDDGLGRVVGERGIAGEERIDMNALSGLVVKVRMCETALGRRTHGKNIRHIRRLLVLSN